jgi:MoaA/NifB/PqqE/SkfB family radical SAM enzyme
MLASVTALQDALKKGQVELLAGASHLALQHKSIRTPLLDLFEERTLSAMDKVLAEDKSNPPAVIELKRQTLVALLRAFRKYLETGKVSPAYLRWGIENATEGMFVGRSDTEAAKARFRAQYGAYPPGVIVISPTKTCNLHCIGCYADSGPTKEKLRWDVFDRIIGEVRSLWGDRFVVISGGEPLAYRDNGHDLLDAVEKHHDCFFMSYTNGTLIDKKKAARMAELGNFSPAFSVEGLKERTDARRGAGVWDRILQAMADLREAGVPFGLSITATRENYREILSEEFLRFFKEQGVVYTWIFHYLPIGRGITIQRMPAPEARMWMWHREEEILDQGEYFVVDFWNGGPVSEGCIAAGREGGYLYIDWNGKVMPCVFAPFAAANINEVYENGGTLNDVYNVPFFQAFREWQHSYGFKQARPEDHGNWIAPCPMRDHHATLRRILERYPAEPEDENVALALQDPGYYAGMVAYDEEFQKLSGEVWRREYLGLEVAH